MKTVKLSLVALLVVASSAVSFAGPGIDYWTNRSKARGAASESKPAVQCAACKEMTVAAPTPANRTPPAARKNASACPGCPNGASGSCTMAVKS